MMYNPDQKDCSQCVNLKKNCDHLPFEKVDNVGIYYGVAITIRQIPFNVEFYWKGERYRQFIRAKNPKTKSKVMCYKVRDQYSGYIEMPMGRVVKPVVRHKNVS